MTNEQAVRIAEALKALVEQMEANGDFAVHIDRLKNLLEFGK